MRAFIAMVMLAVSSISNAVPVTIDFSFTHGNDYLGFPAGSTASGSFSFDNALYSQGGYRDHTNGLQTLALEFTWLGVRWTQTNARIGGLWFDAEGDLRFWLIGALATSACGPDNRINCVAFYANDEPDFFVTESSAAGVLPHTDFEGVWKSSPTAWSIRPTASVPEPASLGLLATGLIGLVIGRRRRTHVASNAGLGFKASDPRFVTSRVHIHG